MNNPLYVSSCSRRGGVTSLSVDGHGLTAEDEGRAVKVVGVSERTVNGEHQISKVIPPDSIQFLQPGTDDIPAAIVGGAIAIGEPVPRGQHKHEVTEEVVNNEGQTTWQDSWGKKKKKK
jgi:hypothetical protein